MRTYNYKTAGVDVDAGNALVETIGHIAKRTHAHKPGVLNDIGGFSALFALPQGYKAPVLVSSTDGVGTKLKLAQQMNNHHGIGIDLVAMCVNDVITAGAEPLFFLDYYATGKLDLNCAHVIIQSISQGCDFANIALIGGETAEMPTCYKGTDYDLAGFCVGVVEKSKIINKNNIKPGDCLIGISSSGLHANGFSLVQQIIAEEQIDLHQPHTAGKSLGEVLLTPTRIYAKTLKQLMASVPVKGLAHITGGGLPDNLVRILPTATCAHIDTASWEWPTIFQWIASQGVDTAEMYRTFNCGIGFVLCVEKTDVDRCLSLLASLEETAWLLGEVRQPTHTTAPAVHLDGLQP